MKISRVEALRAGRQQAAETAYDEILPTLVFLERSINHLIVGSRELLAPRLGISLVTHRLGKHLDEFNCEMIDRFADSLGPFPVAAAALQ